MMMLCFMLVGCGSNDEGDQATEDNNMNDETSEDVQNSSDELEILGGNLQAPWAIAENNGVFYITERDGSVTVIDDGEEQRYDVQLEDELYTEGEAGLLGLALDPQFEDNQQAYMYYTYAVGDDIFNKVVVSTYQDDEQVWVEEETLLDEIPGLMIHNGGRIKIGPDDHLYVTTGDADSLYGQSGETDGAIIAQDLDSLAGKILRLELDGSIPEDNPFNDSYVYSYGHRNPQGITWTEDGDMYSSEHGPTAHDEINAIEAGANYGWPLIKGDEEEDGMQLPVIHSGDDTWAPSGIASYQNDLFFAGLRGEGVYYYDIETEDLQQVVTDYGRVRDVYVLEDSLIFLTNNTDGRGNPSDNDDQLIKIPLQHLTNEAQ
ncbi:hypothetical protein AB990_15210 [Alkalihalobacillus pseudalcaliphilus]|nr:hypothetical protein AB990_15210 [Alkalihalobacillus pseudalcaliphilus]